MPFQNGSGSGGGNGSVWWSIRHNDPNTQGAVRRPRLAKDARPHLGEVAVGDVVNGHDDTPFDKIGVPDHPGCLRVRLRFRYEDWGKIPESTRQIIDQFGVESDKDRSWFVELDVPAIRREPPAQGNDWPDLPWEVQWGW